LKQICRDLCNFSFAPSGLVHLHAGPTAYAVGCNLSPLRGW
jgi:hypothetical protein